jgi:hypothetical protein
MQLTKCGLPGPFELLANDDPLSLSPLKWNLGIVVRNALTQLILLVQKAKLINIYEEQTVR